MLVGSGATVPRFIESMSCTMSVGAVAVRLDAIQITSPFFGDLLT